MNDKNTPLTYNDAHVREALDRVADWDAGRTVSAVVLGGLGPGYEQAIWIMAFEFVRAICRDKPATQADAEKLCDAELRRFDDQIGGATGAMYGAALGIALRLIRDGWESHIKLYPDDRRIMVNRQMPKAPEPSHA